MLGPALAGLALNHLPVAIGEGIVPELLVGGTLFGPPGLCPLVAPGWFDRFTTRAGRSRSGRRHLGAAPLGIVLSLAAAEGVAWFGCGGHLVSC